MAFMSPPRRSRGDVNGYGSFLVHVCEDMILPLVQDSIEDRLGGGERLNRASPKEGTMRRILMTCMVVAFAALPLVVLAQERSSEGYLMPEGAEPRPAVEPTPARPSVEATRDQGLVRDVQVALRDAGFDPGPIDGVMGPQTRAALREFQASQGLPSTGKLDARTRQQLLATHWPGSSERRETPSSPSRDPLSGDPLYRDPPRPGPTAPGASGVGIGR
jgi:hypothetical protein